MTIFLSTASSYLVIKFVIMIANSDQIKRQEQNATMENLHWLVQVIDCISYLVQDYSYIPGIALNEFQLPGFFSSLLCVVANVNKNIF